MDLAVLRDFKLVYLASPYSLFKSGLDAAYEEVAVISYRLKCAEVNNFSPILYTHPLGHVWSVDQRNHDFWLSLDEAFMTACDAMVIAKMEGWEESFGISIEKDIFTRDGKPIFALDPHSMVVRPC